MTNVQIASLQDALLAHAVEAITDAACSRQLLEPTAKPQFCSQIAEILYLYDQGRSEQVAALTRQLLDCKMRHPLRFLTDKEIKEFLSNAQPPANHSTTHPHVCG